MSWKRREVIGHQTLYLGDCLEVMPALGKVDAVVTDPPYGIGEGNAKGQTRGKLAAPRQYAGSDGWDAAPATSEHISMMRNASEHQIIFGGNYFDKLGPTPCWLVWDKQNGENDFADCELAWTNLPKAVRIFRWQWNGFIRKGEMDKTRSPVFRVHPTQKPVALMEWCLGFLPNAQTILDPFMGSGTTLVACAKLGRKGIGIELDPDYFDIACRRVEAAYRQPDLFIPAPAPKPTQEAMDL